VQIKFHESYTIFFQEDETGLAELKLGGIVYVIGVIFFKCDGRIPLAHAIWHLFVVAGSMIHYFAVVNYLFGMSNDPNEVLVEITPEMIHSEL